MFYVVLLFYVLLAQPKPNWRRSDPCTNSARSSRGDGRSRRLKWRPAMEQQPGEKGHPGDGQRTRGSRCIDAVRAVATLMSLERCLSAHLAPWRYQGGYTVVHRTSFWVESHSPGGKLVESNVSSKKHIADSPRNASSSARHAFASDGKA